MTNRTISDLFLDGDFFEQLTKEELEMDICGAGAGAGSVSAAKYSQKDNNVVEEVAVTASVAASDRKPFTIYTKYSFEPLFVDAGVSFR